MNRKSGIKDVERDRMMFNGYTCYFKNMFWIPQANDSHLIHYVE